MRLPKKLMLATLLVIAATSAYPQDDDPIQVSPERTEAARQAAQQKFYLELTQEDLNAVSAALIELPKKVADPLILKFNAQLAKQAEITAARDAAQKPPQDKKGRK